MMSPYVQNVTKWINHYSPKTTADTTVSPNSDNLFSGNSIGLAQQGHMNVSQVEQKAPAPPVPSTGPSTALRTMSTSQATIQQAVFDAKRDEIEKDEAGGKLQKYTAANGMKTKKNPTKSKGKKGKPKNSKTKKDIVFGKSALLGTPADIFKSRTLKKKKK